MDYKQIQTSMERIVGIISNNIDKEMQKNEGYIEGQPFKLRFYHSTPIEFVNVVGKESVNQKLPFFFVNSMLSSEGDGIWVIKDIVIATMSDKNWTREKRDAVNFKPILIPVLQEFHRILCFDRDLSVYRTGDTIFHYFYGETGLKGYEAHKFTQSVDAIQLKNFQFKMSRNCLTYKK